MTSFRVWRAGLVLEVLGMLAVLGMGCGSGEAPPAPDPAPTPAPVATETPEPAAAVAAPVEAPPPAPEPLVELDLLHAAPARVAVSSAYRDDLSQVARIVDGDMTTAWNSLTGDLVGAWIEVEVPAEAQVRAIAMTSGFTRRSASSDLFTGNHRIARVRLSRWSGSAWTPLGEHTLDVASRELVEVPVGGPGGRFRIDAIEVLPGSREDWRETCVSEVRVLGTLAGAVAGSRHAPATSVGPLEEAAPGVAGETEAATEGEQGEDEAAEEAREAAEEAREAAEDEAILRGMAIEIAEDAVGTWSIYSAMLAPYLDQPATRGDARGEEERARANRRRSEVLTEIAEQIEDYSPEHASTLRTRASAPPSPWFDRRADLDAILRAIDTVIARYPEHACAWANLRGVARLRDYIVSVGGESFRVEGILEDGRDDEGVRLSADDRTRYRAALTDLRALERRLQPLDERAPDTLDARTRREVLELPPTTTSWMTAEWEALRADVERAETACAR